MSFQNNSQKPVISETSQSNEASLAIIRNMAKNKLVEISSQLESGTDAFIVRDTIFAVEAGFASISRADEVIYQANMSLTPETKVAYQSWRSSIIKAPLSPDERSKIRADREQKEKDQKIKARERDAKRGPEEKKPNLQGLKNLQKLKNEKLNLQGLRNQKQQNKYLTRQGNRKNQNNRDY